MTDKRRHRGPHPGDEELFAPDRQTSLCLAADDLGWLLGRGYVTPSALKLVGDRYSLTARQRQAVMRCAGSEADVAARRSKEVDPASLEGLALCIDGFNVLTTLETALSGGYVFHARDGCYRDVAGIHGSYRVLAETEPVLRLALEELGALRVERVQWFFDESVSNSGRVKVLLADIAEARGGGPDLDIQLVPDPDPILAGSGEIIATSDSVVLDACRHWFNLARHLVTRRVPDADVVTI